MRLQIGVAWAMFLSSIYQSLVVDANIPERSFGDIPLGRLQGHLGRISPHTARDLILATRCMQPEQLRSALRPGPFREFAESTALDSDMDISRLPSQLKRIHLT